MSQPENYDSLDLSDLESFFENASGQSDASAKETPAEEAAPPAEPPNVPDSVVTTPEDVDLDFENLTGMAAPSDLKAEGLIKPWMRFHKFTLIQSADALDQLVDQAIAHGSCALDLETEGLDNRIDYDAAGRPRTKHQIVGACIAIKGDGYYIPVRHKFESVYGQADPNLSESRFEAALKKLCQAAQPEIEPEAYQEDPLGSKSIKTPPKVVIKFWNAKFDQEFLYPVTGIDFWHPESFEDGQLARYSCYTDDWSFKLKDKSAEFLEVKDPKTGAIYPYEMIKFPDLFSKEVPKHARKIAELYPEPDSPVVKYGCSDAICTDLLTDKFLVDVAELNVGGVYRLEKQAVQVVRLMERNRTRIDAATVEEILVEARKELEKLEKQIVDLAKSKGFQDFNPASPKQLSEFLFDPKGLDISPKPKETDSGQFKTDSDTLESLIEMMHDPPQVLQWVIFYRQIQRVIGTYLERFLNDCDEHQQLRFNFNQIGAATGRFTAPAGNPDEGFFGGPIQGIPARNDPKKHPLAHSLRKVFIAHEGYSLVKADYAGQELRIVANISGEPLWVNEFLNGTGDLHTLTAKAFFNKDVVTKDERNQGKTANFALIYGGGIQAIQRATGVDKTEAARKKQAFDKSVPTFAKWLKKQHAQVKKELGVWTGFRRWIAIPDANVKPGETLKSSRTGKGAVVDVALSKKVRASCERKSVNFPIQGSGADIMKISLVRLAKEFYKRGWHRDGGDDSVRMLMSIHDEIVFEIKHHRLEEAVPLLCKTMEEPSSLVRWRIPLVVEPLVGKAWDAKYDWVKIKEGKEPVPDWLQGHVTPGAAPEQAPVPEVLQPKAPSQSLAQDTPSNGTPPRSKVKSHDEVAVFSVSSGHLSEMHFRIVGAACMLAWDEDGKLLQLTDDAGTILIAPTLGIRVNPAVFGQEIRTRNLGHGRFEVVPYVETGSNGLH